GSRDKRDRVEPCHVRGPGLGGLHICDDPWFSFLRARNLRRYLEYISRRQECRFPRWHSPIQRRQLQPGNCHQLQQTHVAHFRRRTRHHRTSTLKPHLPLFIFLAPPVAMLTTAKSQESFTIEWSSIAGGGGL